MSAALQNGLRGACLVTIDGFAWRVEPLRFIPPRLTMNDDFSLLTHFRPADHAPDVERASAGDDQGGEQHHGEGK